MKKVYFAGKVAKGNWRDRLLGCRCMSMGEHQFAPGLLYVGPFGLGCDHGCAHRPGTHAATEPAIGNYKNCCDFTPGGCFDETYISREELVSRCIRQINASDLVVAYLEAEAHGTIAEIGYASAVGKTVMLWIDHALAKDKKTHVDEFWFIKRLPSVAFMGYGEPEKDLMLFRK